MSRKAEHSAAEKLFILQEIDIGLSLSEASQKFNVGITTIKDWRRRYRQFGSNGLEVSARNRHYSLETKLQAVQDYFSGDYSQQEVADKYQLRDRRQLRDWIVSYTGHSLTPSPSSQRSVAMTKGRSTTWQERLDIVLYCLAHEHDYMGAANQFQVSYQQVYGWTKKYEAGGQDALRDRRGRNKAPEELTDADRQKLEMKKLEYENERLRAENAFLKKLQEFERRRH